MKKLLLLGGSAQQIVAIETAKRLGYFTVLCDYLPDNPGQYHADKFYLVSTTDKDAVLKVAQNERVDGVLAYASDPAAPTAAYVAEKLGLPGNPYRSVEILCNKDLFRQFLASHGFNTPQAEGFDSAEEAARHIGDFRLPVIVKPVDSSGSKGVSMISDIRQADGKLKAAMEYSRCGRIIVEEFVEKLGYQVAGDGLSVDGKLVFRCFANDHFDASGANPFVPIAASFPYAQPSEIHDKIHGEIQRLLTLLGMRTCTYNFDIRIDDQYRVYLMEIAPRDGGNYIPQVIRYATGVDLVECSVLAAMGEPVGIPADMAYDGHYAYFAVHSDRDGILKSIRFRDGVYEKHVLEDHIVKKAGEPVRAFTGANTALGCLVMRFDSMDEMLGMMDRPDTWLTVEVD